MYLSHLSFRQSLKMSANNDSNHNNVDRWQNNATIIDVDEYDMRNSPLMEYNDSDEENSHNENEEQQRDNNQPRRQSLLQKNSKNKQSLDKVTRFLKHPSIATLSPSVKESYLLSKNDVTKETIQLALKRIEEENLSASNRSKRNEENHDQLNRIWHKSNETPKSDDENDTTTRRNNYIASQDHGSYPITQSPNPHTRQENDAFNAYPQNFQQHQQSGQPSLPELPNPVVPMTIGGFIAIFGLATYRWINGGDFVLFPDHLIQSHEQQGQPIQDSPDATNLSLVPAMNEERERQRTSPQSIENDENHTCDVNDDGIDNGIIPDEVEDHTEKEQGDRNNNPTYHQISDRKNDLNDTNIISKDIKNLTLVIEKFVALHERSMKEKADEKAKEATNNVMDILRNHENSIDAKEQATSDESSMSGKDSKANGAMERKGLCNSQRIGGEIVDVLTLIQITEFKCAVKEMTNQFVSENSSLEDVSKSKHKLHESFVMKLEEISTYLKKLQDKLFKEEYQISTDLGSSRTNVSEEIISKDTSDSDQMKDQYYCNSQGDIKENIKVEDENDLKSKEMKTPGIDGNCLESSNVLVGKENLLEAIENLQVSNEPKIVKSCAQMMFLYASNLSSNPNSDQYRKIYTNSKTFTDKISKVDSAKDVLLSIGFVENKSILHWKSFSNLEDDIALVKDAAMLLSKLKKGQRISRNEVDMVDESPSLAEPNPS